MKKKPGKPGNAYLVATRPLKARNRAHTRGLRHGRFRSGGRRPGRTYEEADKMRLPGAHAGCAIAMQPDEFHNRADVSDHG